MDMLIAIPLRLFCRGVKTKMENTLIGKRVHKKYTDLTDIQYNFLKENENVPFSV